MQKTTLSLADFEVVLLKAAGDYSSETEYERDTNWTYFHENWTYWEGGHFEQYARTDGHDRDSDSFPKLLFSVAAAIRLLDNEAT